MKQRDRKKIQLMAIYMVLGVIGIILFMTLVYRPLVVQRTEESYDQFLARLENGDIESVTLNDDQIIYTLRGDETTSIYHVMRVEDPDLTGRLVAADVEFKAQISRNSASSTLMGILIPLIPLALIWFFFLRQMGGAGQGVISFGKNKAQEISGEMTGVSFADVGGADEVALELKEIIEFLKDPGRFTRLGAKLPKGILLVGPPGTGKTLLAKATAGEAGVPFFSISGSTFVEMFVGVGAARVRDLFQSAKQRAPVIIFIDEIDAVGRTRNSASNLGGNDEREQTLNQLLAEMDGFQTNEGVVIMAATNRPEILDPALLRPGRFDRQVQVGSPTEGGRAEILAIHAREVCLGPDVDLARIAKITPGFSGADLANIVNEAALLAVRRESEVVTMQDFDLAIERVVAGLKKNIPLRGEVKRRVAYHESGHALVAHLLPRTDPVHKVSIIPTAKGALGYTLQMPEEDQFLMGEGELKERMAVMLGGRAAEMLACGEVSTGAANDLERATGLARRMVTEFGMAEALGPVRYAAGHGHGYLETFSGLRSELSPAMADRIDEEIKRLVEEAQTAAVGLLEENLAALHELARALEEKESIGGQEVAEIIASSSVGSVAPTVHPVGQG